MPLLPGPSGQVSLPTALPGVPEGFRWGEERVQIEGGLPGAGRRLARHTASADRLLLRLRDKPLRRLQVVALGLDGAFPEVLVPADVDVPGEAVGARPESQALGLGRVGQAGRSPSPRLRSLLNDCPLRMSCEGPGEQAKESGQR